MHHFTAGDRLIRDKDILSTELDQETILMSIDAGAYYGLAGTAQWIWEKLEAPITFAGLVDALLKEYDVPPAACAADLQKFLEGMVSEGLLHVE